MKAEETVFSGRYSNNGADPMWCLGNTCIARRGEDVFVSAYERLAGFEPYNDCRWVLLKRTPAGWERQQADDTGRQREPSPLGCLPDGRLVLSSNPTLLPSDASGGGPARPELIEFDAANPTAPARRQQPKWSGTPPFNQHSYRSMAVDGTNGELILFQNVDYSHSEWAFRARNGEWLSGQLQWPPYSATDLAPFGATHARVNYPVVRLRGRAAHFMGTSSFDNWSRVTTAEELERYTGKDAGSMDGWIFGLRARRVRYTWTERIGETPFHKWVEIDDALDDGGLVFPGDLHVDESGTVHLLWYKGPMQQYARDKWFPDIELRASIRYATLRDGKVLQRRVLTEAGKHRTVKMFGEVPNTGSVAFHGQTKKILRGGVLATPRFHVTPDGGLFVVYYVSDGAGLSENRIMEIRADGTTFPAITIPLKHPLIQFFTATPRAGCAPSWTLDLLGRRRGTRCPIEATDNEEHDDTLSYARVNLIGNGAT